MRYAIISDIHGNLEALTVALASIDSQEIDRLVCLGDIVGYGADPSACLDLVRARTEYVVIGNHDLGVLADRERRQFNHRARTAIEWTASQLSDEQRAYLETLPFKLSIDSILFVHASPENPERMSYILSRMEAMTQRDAFTERICFVGHTHRPMVLPLESSVRAYDAEHRFLINPGSVGQPRDGDPRLSYGILDTVAGTYDNVRLAYDHALAGSKILRAGLPEALAIRLEYGE